MENNTATVEVGKDFVKSIAPLIRRRQDLKIVKDKLEAEIKAIDAVLIVEFDEGGVKTAALEQWTVTRGNHVHVHLDKGLLLKRGVKAIVIEACTVRKETPMMIVRKKERPEKGD